MTNEKLEKLYQEIAVARKEIKRVKEEENIKSRNAKRDRGKENEHRYKKMRKDRMNGMTYTDMAIKYGLSAQYCSSVCRQINEYKPKGEFYKSIYKSIKKTHGAAYATRVCNALGRAGIEKYEQAEALGTDEILKMRNLGKVAVRAIEEYINSNGGKNE